MIKMQKYFSVRPSKIILLILVILLFVMPTNKITSAEILQEPEITSDHPQNEKRVLFISSFSIDWEPVKLQIEGLQTVLDESITLNYEFMNSKLVNDEESYEYFYESMKYRLSVIEAYDVIIVGDDMALQFASEYKDELFPNTPVVFEGVNNIDLAVTAGKHPQITGVVEQVSYTKNIDVAVSINPNAKNIVAIVDATENGYNEQIQFLKNRATYPLLHFGLLDSSMYTYDEFCRKLSELSNDTILLFLSCSEDINGTNYTKSQAYSMISEHAGIPVFGMTQSGVGQGILGAYAVSHKESGKIAGEMALDILNGRNPAEIEVILDSPNHYYFDFQVMKKYNLKVSSLPQNTILVNEDVSILKRNAGIIIPTLMYIIGGIILIGFTGLLTNLRERNKLIKKVNNKNNQLLIAVEKAEKATIQAKRASTAKTDFLSRMSHDIRTPMNAIIGLTEITKTCADNPKIVRTNLERIDHSSKYLLDLINDILAMSRIESGKETLRLERFDMHESLISIRDIIQTQSVIKEVTFILSMDENVEKYYIGDNNKIKQIIMNLLSNALKFTNPEDQIELSVREKYSTEDESALEIIVSDTGIGVEDEFISRMFEPFEQADKDIARNHTGSGLGLSIVKHFVEMMNGNIKVESEEGIGTKFTILISLKKYIPEVASEAMLEKVSGKVTEAVLEEATEVISEQMEDSITFRSTDTDEKSKETKVSKESGTCCIDAEITDDDSKNIVENMSNDKDSVNADTEVKTGKFDGINILLAEDNEINLEIAQTILEMKGFCVDPVRNGLEAVDRFDEMPEYFYQCILMDIRMPVMSGIEATIEIRKSESEYARTIPIIALTANAFQEDIEATKTAGMNAHLSKPIQPDVMFDALEKIIIKIKKESYT